MSCTWISVIHYTSQKGGGVVKDAHGLWGPLMRHARVNKHCVKSPGGKFCWLQRRTSGHYTMAHRLNQAETMFKYSNSKLTTLRSSLPYRIWQLIKINWGREGIKINIAHEGLTLLSCRTRVERFWTRMWGGPPWLDKWSWSLTWSRVGRRVWKTD